MTYQMDDGAVQELLFPEPTNELPEDEPLTVENANVFYRSIVLFPNFYGFDLYETALTWFALEDSAKQEIVDAASVILGQTNEYDSAAATQEVEND